MQTKKILIAETSAEFSEQLCKYLGGTYTLRVCRSGLQVEELLAAFHPDVLVMDLALPGQDGISLLKKIAGQPHRPRILLTTCFLSSYVEAAIAEFGVDMVMLKPCNVSAMADRIYDLTREEQKLAPPVQEECTISVMLMNLDIPPKRKGFDYLRLSIELYRQDPCQSVTKCLYPQVAKAFCSNPAAVERAIRQVIHESWSRRDETMWRQYFHTARDGMVPRPTNVEFIAQLAEWQKRLSKETA